MPKKTEKKEKEITKSTGKLITRVTEKASNATAQGVYTFKVSATLNKTEIKKEFFKIYKVKPVKVNILAVPKKRVAYRGRPGQKGGGKKALVFLKQGDKIEFI